MMSLPPLAVREGVLFHLPEKKSFISKESFSIFAWNILTLRIRTTLEYLGKSRQIKQLKADQEELCKSSAELLQKWNHLEQDYEHCKQELAHPGATID